jgi:hypothetical protein
MATLPFNIMDYLANIPGWKISRVVCYKVPTGKAWYEFWKPSHTTVEVEYEKCKKQVSL